MKYRFKNGKTKEYQEEIPECAESDDIDETMHALGYTTWFDSQDSSNTANHLFKVVVYAKGQISPTWIVHTWDENYLLDEFYVENSFDLALLLKTLGYSTVS